jgi:hypothetical protein
MAFAQDIGAIHGTVVDPTGAVVVGANVVVQMDGAQIVRTIATDQQGRYQITGLPTGRFLLRVTAPGFQPAESAGQLTSNGAAVHGIRLAVEGVAESTTVVQRLLIDPDASGPRRNLNLHSLTELPKSAPNRAMSSAVKTLPGVVEEENGRLHVRGSEVQPQYVLDGVPIADNLSGTFGTELDTQSLESAELITGNVPAQFGPGAGTVINVSTRSGLNAPLHARFGVSAGSFTAGAANVQIGGRIGRFGVFAGADAARTNRFLDPPGFDDNDEEAAGRNQGDDEEEERSVHNNGGAVRLFTRFDWPASNKDVFHLTVSANGTNFQVPNSAESQEAGQDQRQELRDDFQSFAWNHRLNSLTEFGVALSRRSSTARLLDPLKTGFPFYAEQNRRQRSEGFKASLTRTGSKGNLYIGGETYRYPIREQFQGASTEIEGDDPNEPIGQYTPETPFVFDQRKTSMRTAVYAQGRLQLLRRLSADVGVRFDDYRIVVKENALTPRVGVAYSFSRTSTVLRAAYNRLFHTPPMENLLLSSTPSVAVLSPTADEVTTRPVLPERQNHYEFGVQQQVGQHFRVDVAHYVKKIRNFSDEEQFLSSGIVFPVSLARADIQGTELRLDLLDVYGFRAYGSYANANATITTPITGGLFLNDEGEGEEGFFNVSGVTLPADQDERNEVHFGTTYVHKSGAWAGLEGRYDSGVPTHFDPAEYPTFDPLLQAQLDPIRQRIKPRMIFSVAAGIKLFRERENTVSLQFGINNLFDRFYLYNFRSVFSGTHLGRPQDLFVRMVVDWGR